jgi:hypothetical protein
MDDSPISDKDNYPMDIFPELSPFELECVNNMCKKILGFPLDRLSAHIGRELIAHRLDEERKALSLADSEIKKLIPPESTDTYGQGLTDALKIIHGCFQIGEKKDDNSETDIQRPE